MFVIADMIPIDYSLYTPILMCLTEKGIAMREQARMSERTSELERDSFSLKRKVIKTKDNTNVSVIAPLLPSSSSSSSSTAEESVHYTSNNQVRHSLMHNSGTTGGSSSTSNTNTSNYVVVQSNELLEEEDIVIDPSNNARNTNDSQNGNGTWLGTVSYWLGYSS